MEGRTLKERQSEATRAALVKTARRLFARDGYAAVSVEGIVRRAKMTRGALYHHFSDKADLFRAVAEQVEAELVEQAAAAAAKEPRPEKHLEVGCQALFDACLDQDVRRILLIDGPSVLGWEAWREMDAKYALGLLREALEAAMDEGYIERHPVEPLALMLLGALGEASLGIARADDVERARVDFGETFARLLSGLKKPEDGKEKLRDESQAA